MSTYRLACSKAPASSDRNSGTTTSETLPRPITSDTPITSPGDPAASACNTTKPSDGRVIEATTTAEPSTSWSSTTSAAGPVAGGSCSGATRVVGVGPAGSSAQPL